jgi:hypothetical protein
MENSTPRSLLVKADNLSENFDARVNISRSFLVTQSIRRHFESHSELGSSTNKLKNYSKYRSQGTGAAYSITIYGVSFVEFEHFS